MNLEAELSGLTDNLLADTRIIYVTRNQVGGLNGLLNQGLEDKSPDNRHAVLNLLAGTAMLRIAGVKVRSATNLTSPVASFLINILKDNDSTQWRLSDYGKELINQAETRVKTQPL